MSIHDLRTEWPRAALLALAVALAAWGVWAVWHPAALRLERAQVVVLTAAGARHVFTVEVAASDPARARGLMHRDALAPDAGMLFAYPAPRDDIAFWMKNTHIPLDILFAGADGTITRIHARAQPHDATPIPGGPGVRYVLEIPGGRAAALGIAPGDRIALAGALAEPG